MRNLLELSFTSFLLQLVITVWQAADPLEGGGAVTALCGTGLLAIAGVIALLTAPLRRRPSPQVAPARDRIENAPTPVPPPAVESASDPRFRGGFAWIDGPASLRGMEPMHVVEVGDCGMQVRMREPARAARRFVARIPCQDDSLCLEGEVMWNRKSWGMYDVGVRFVSMDEADRHRLRTLAT